jgi:late competence protein required for DNA uptake (superfamily II DNA/RNA helicase)
MKKYEKEENDIECVSCGLMNAVRLEEATCGCMVCPGCIEAEEDGEFEYHVCSEDKGY